MKPLDPAVMSAVAVAVVGLSACVVPTDRARRVDPVIVPRDQ
ncbi:MAG TPA: hypothetical protein VGH38_33115 [Bryobacteraceae bacterium]